jgi:predicted metal-dependent peptidase
MHEHQKSLSTIARYCVTKSPGFAAIALWVPHRFRDTEQYIARTDGRSIEAGQKFFDKYDGREQAFIFMHEVLHVALRHVPRGHRAWSVSSAHALVWNLACFPAGTWTGFGKPIEEVATMCNAYNDDLILIESQAGRVRATKEHPFWIKKRVGTRYPIQTGEAHWAQAEDIEEGDYVLVPRLSPEEQENVEVIDLRGFIAEGADSKGRQTFGNRATKEVPLNEDVAWLIGMYVAEGSASPMVRFSLSIEEQDYADRLIAVLESIGHSATISRNEEGHSMSVNSGAVVFGRWLKAHCGTDAHSKHVPQAILRHSNPRIRRAFLQGVVDGDGCGQKSGYHARRGVTVGVVSQSLIHDLVLLLAQDGEGGSVNQCVWKPRQIGDSFCEKETTLFRLNYCPDGISYSTRELNGKTIRSWSHSWRSDEQGVWYKVKKVSKTPYQGLVYNLSTPSHTYIAACFLVHNCDAIINRALDKMSWIKTPKDLVTFESLLDKEELEARPPQNWSAEALYYRLLEKIGFPADKQSWEKWLDDYIEKNGLPKPDDLGRGPNGDEDGGDLMSELASRVWASRLARAQAGDRPGGLLRELVGDFPVVKTPWPQILRTFLQDAVMPTTRENFNRPGRRVLSLDSEFFEPSFQSEKGVRRIGVAVDTSGSIDQKILLRFAGEIEAVQKRTGAELYLVVCDAEVTGEFLIPAYGKTFTQRYKAGELQFLGGGGTDFRPAIEKLNKSNVKIGLYLTDTYGAFPESAPKMPFIWCSTTENANVPWGKLIYLDPLDL